jgi:hypothetical protein
MKNAIVWDVTPCGCCKNRRFGGTYRLYHQDGNNLHRVRLLLVNANVVPSSPIPVILMIKAVRSTETSVLTRATRRNIPEDGILNKNISEIAMQTFLHLQANTAPFLTRYMKHSQCQIHMSISFR